MKYAIYAGLLVAGVVIGYLMGINSVSEPQEQTEPQTEYITEMVVDTVIQKETVKVPIAEEEIDSAKIIPDSLLALNDSLELLIPEDTTEDISIRREKMIEKKWLSINVLEEFDDSDSLLKAMMGISDQMPTRLLVEIWESPLNFSGYKLSRSKLVLYGMPSGIEYKLYRKKDNYFLSAQTFYYSLKETEDFLPYLEVSKEAVFND